jgi:hypothetical protein
VSGATTSSPALDRQMDAARRGPGSTRRPAR